MSPTRVERSVPLKALVAQINYNLFDIELGQQQSQFAYLQAKDLADTVDGVLRTHDVALWNGNDTSLSSPTTAQYFGAAAQIAAGGNTVTIGTNAEHCRRLQVDDRADGGEHLLRRSSDGDLCQPGAARSDRSRDEDGVQRGAEHQGDRRRLHGEDAVDPGWRYSADSGVDAELHRHTGLGHRVLPAYIVTEDLIEYHWLERPESAHLPAWRSGLAGLAVCRGEVWRPGGEGRELCALPGAGRPLESVHRASRLN